MIQALVLYASTHGHTAKIARRIAASLEDAGVLVDLRRADPMMDIDPRDYDAVVVGASVHAGRHQHVVVDWLRHHAATLSTMPSAFFSVSLSAADDTDEGRAAARGYIDDLIARTRWTPQWTRSFAGALQYREYDVFTRLLIKLMLHRGWEPADTSRDHDFTDWDAVDRFAQQCTELLPLPTV